MPTIESVFQAIDEATARSDADALRRAAYDLETVLMEGDPGVASEIAEGVIRRLGTAEFRAAPSAWHVLFAVRDDLENLSEEKRRRLFLAMVDAFDSFADWMSSFVVSEMAEYFATGWALQAVRTRLADTDERVRRYVPHTLEHIARAAPESTVAREAFDSLVAMLRDPAPEVREEARTSLGRIAGTEGDLAALAKDLLVSSG